MLSLFFRFLFFMVVVFFVSVNYYDNFGPEEFFTSAIPGGIS